jgi:hypothetical protein
MTPAAPQAGKVIDPSRSVFINCPYDAEFAPLMNAMLFATVCCGFVPRSANESGSVGTSRIDRIVDTLFASRFSIHDLSRCRGEGHEQLARFNMPLELGMAMALSRLTRKKKTRHEWFVLVPDGHAYHQFVSDLAAYDPAKYDGTVDTVVRRVMSWLITRDGAVAVLKPPQVLEALPDFQAAASKLEADWGGTVWGELIDTAAKHVPKV